MQVGDFGMSRVLDRSKSMTVCGTAETCAPEVLSRNSYTEKADVFSFGIVLWEVFTRDVLYPGLNFYELSSKVVNEHLRPPLEKYNFDTEIKQLLTSCWQADPNLRPTFKVIVATLEKYLEKVQSRKKKRKSTYYTNKGLLQQQQEDDDDDEY